MTKAQETRSDAVRTLTDKWMVDNPPSVRAASRETIVAEIRALADLGRTLRWDGAIRRWAEMVADEDNPVDWALLQGAVYAGHAAI